MHGSTSTLTTLLFLLLLFISSLATADRIVIVADEWCPYNCTPNTSHPGFIVEAVDTIFKQAGHELVYQLLPWKRAVEDTRKGKYNGLIGFGRKVDGFINTEMPFGLSEEVFFVRSDSDWRYNTIDDLRTPGVIGYPNGYRYTPDIDQYLAHSSNVSIVSGTQPLEQLIKLIMTHRIDTFPENRMVAEYYMSHHRLKDMLKIAGSFHKTQLYVSFSEKSANFERNAQLLSEGIIDLRKSGRLAEILLKYGINDWHTPPTP